MPSEFIQRQVERLLAQAAEDLARLDWDSVRGRAEAVLRLDPGNADAEALIAAATGGPSLQPSSEYREREGRLSRERGRLARRGEGRKANPTWSPS